MISVEVIHNNIDRALKQLKSRCEMDGTSLQLKMRSYPKPSERRKIKVEQALTRRLRQEAKKIINAEKREKMHKKANKRCKINKISQGGGKNP